MPRQSGAFAIALLLAVDAGVAAAAEESYVTDPAHSQPSYEIRHTIFSTQRGDFLKSTGKITIDREAKKGSIDVSIDTTSIRSHDPRLDNILKGEDYFNVAKYPTMTFKSTAMRFDGDRLTGHEGREIIGEIDCELADFLQLSRSRDRMHLALEVDDLFPVRLELRRLDRDRRLDEAGKDRID